MRRWALVTRARMHARCAEALARLQCRISPRAYVVDLRVAERQLVEIARALTIDASPVVMISVLPLSPFIVTLGTMGAFRGASMLLSGSRPVVGMPDRFQVLGIARALDLGREYAVPWSLVVTLGGVVVAGFVLRYTRFGRYVYAIGSNEQTARLCAVPVHKVKIGAYVVSGLAAGVAGIIVASRMNSASPEAPGTELEVIAAVVIGGGSLMGGQGTVIGTLVGAFLMRFLRKGCNLVGVTTIVQWIVVGVVIIPAALLDKLRHGAGKG